ncbi:hypothetical protein MMC25_001905 [Agyrium rufum]|nr:hypothetical protein [Agyrium rufum]
MSQPPFATPPPPTSFSKLSFPSQHLLLVIFNRPTSLNCINNAGHHELDAVWTWFDNEPSLRVGIVTGAGRAFCAGADLKGFFPFSSLQCRLVQSIRTEDLDRCLLHPLVEWNKINALPGTRPEMPPSGFGALSTRTGRKPIIAAVNGICFGGGFEMVINTDLVVASHAARFSLPEVKVGVVAVAGALPRIARTLGKQRAMELALTGRQMSAQEAQSWGLVNTVVSKGKDVVEEAVRLAREIATGVSPDSVIVSRMGILAGWDGSGVEEGTDRTRDEWFRRIVGKENMVEGVQAFVEKRKPRWVDSKL